MTMMSTTSSQQPVEDATEHASRSATTLLVAVGSSADESPAVKLSAALARQQHARVHVVHVREHQVYGGAVVSSETADEARQLVEKAMSEIRSEGVEATGHMLRTIAGHVPAAILSEAADVGAAQIIIDAKRPGSVFRRRTTQRLLRRSWLPVVIAPCARTRRQLVAGTSEPSSRRAA
jgi:nucleotide-binding universal stress UspA family protein